MTETEIRPRWWIRRDTDQVMRIENASFPYPAPRSEIIETLRTRNVIGLVIEINDKIVGYMIYEFHKYRLEILNLAVDPDYRKQGIGRCFITTLINKLSMQRRKRISVVISESNLNAQLFFKQCGFIATEVFRDYYGHPFPVEDAYLMEYIL